MVSVVVAALSVLGIVLAGLIPAIAISRRGRLLKLLRAESAALEEVKDPRAKRHLRAALRASTAEYQRVAQLTPQAKLRRSMVVLRPFAAAFLVLGFIFQTFNERLTTSDQNAEILRWIGVGFFSTGALMTLWLVFRYSLITFDDRALRRAKAQTKVVNDQYGKLEGSVDALIAKANVHGHTGPGQTVEVHAPGEHAKLDADDGQLRRVTYRDLTNLTYADLDGLVRTVSELRDERNKHAHAVTKNDNLHRWFAQSQQPTSDPDAAFADRVGEQDPDDYAEPDPNFEPDEDMDRDR